MKGITAAVGVTEPPERTQSRRKNSLEQDFGRPQNRPMPEESNVRIVFCGRISTVFAYNRIRQVN